MMREGCALGAGTSDTKAPTAGVARLGAVPVHGGVRFVALAPGAERVDLVLEPGGETSAHESLPMQPATGGRFERVVAGVGPGARYWYRLSGGPAHPDPASRYQPDGVHGPSMVIDPRAYAWQDGDWRPPEQRDLVFYELHVGTFTPEGTFASARAKLPYLRELGVTAVELMPVADFPGRWNWGYDVAALFAPSRAYGEPDDLRALIDEAHTQGLAVILDVIYNHVGPDGAYAPAFNPRFFSATHHTPWGPAINLDGPGSDAVRALFVENALHWLTEYHADGLRLDATHAIVDASAVPFLRELADAVRALPGPRRYLIAEDHRNLNRLALPPAACGFGLDALWSDDYHHQVRRLLAGDRDGYYADFEGRTTDLATTLRQGWLYTGQYSRYFEGPRGTTPSGLAPERFVHFIQNHDQVGNRPQGTRLTTDVSPAAYRAASALLLFAPALPLLFMGQEWASSSPFCYFTDHGGDLGAQVREGRRREFQRFEGFRAEVPDPEDPATFERSRLDWSEPQRPPHVQVLRLYRDLLTLRRRLSGDCQVHSPVEGTLVLRRGSDLLAVALSDGLTVPTPRGCKVVWTTEDPPYVMDPAPPRRRPGGLHFLRPGAIIARVP